MLMRRAQAEIDELQGEFPLTKAALDQFESALKQETPERRKGFKRRRGPEERKASRTLNQNVRRLLTKNNALSSSLEATTGAKRSRRQICIEWLVRVAFATPLASARSLTTAFRDVCDVDEHIVSRATISKIKDVFVEVLKSMMLKYLACLVCASDSVAAATKAPFQNVLLTHIQDEADLRLRSFL